MLDKILRVYDGDGMDAAIAYVCNSQTRVEPELAVAWVSYQAATHAAGNGPRLPAADSSSTQAPTHDDRRLG